MDWISTGLALVALSCCVFCVAQCFGARNECAETETSLRRSLGRIAALEAEADVLAKQLHKLRGKLYADKSGTDEKLQTEIARPFTQGIVCENWSTAQRDGPRSDAAKCECDYCTAKRAEREATRARLVPKSPKERADAIEKGRH